MTTVTHLRPPWAKPTFKSVAPHALWHQESSQMTTVTHLRPPWAKPAFKSAAPHTLWRQESSHMATVTHLRPAWAKPALKSDTPHTLWRQEGSKMMTVTRFVGKIHQSRAALTLERPNRSSFFMVFSSRAKEAEPKMQTVTHFWTPGAQKASTTGAFGKGHFEAFDL